LRPLTLRDTRARRPASRGAAAARLAGAALDAAARRLTHMQARVPAKSIPVGPLIVQAERAAAR
jgi:hypothetical protein